MSSWIEANGFFNFIVASREQSREGSASQHALFHLLRHLILPRNHVRLCMQHVMSHTRIFPGKGKQEKRVFGTGITRVNVRSFGFGESREAKEVRIRLDRRGTAACPFILGTWVGPRR